MSARGSGQPTKRSLPSWMSSRENNKSDEESKGDEDSSNTNRSTHKRTREDNRAAKQNSEDSNANHFSKLLEGVVFVLSGFVNPERGMLRSQALEMGAEFQQDWNSNCTLLVCAFPNTPKFRQVEAQCGTIVSKEWITECYTQKKLVDIDSYLMHAGKPWRKSNTCHVLGNVDSTPPPRESQKQDKGPRHETSASRGGSSNSVDEELSPAKVKKWAADDLKKTMAWLDSQDEKPEADELKTVAVEGVLTCLQDAIDLLEKKQDLNQIAEQWGFIPRVVEELIKSVSAEGTTVSNQHLLHKRALSYKKMYEDVFRKMEGNSKMKEKSENTGSRRQNKSGKDRSVGSKTDYDSDETIEMTEEEIDLAFGNISSGNLGS